MPVHAAEVELLVGDAEAVGAAVTVALCGHWEHPPPCPLAPHHTVVRAEGGRCQVRVVFACSEEAEGEVRRRIVAALAAGGGDLVRGQWRLVAEHPSVPTTVEQEHALRIAGS